MKKLYFLILFEIIISCKKTDNQQQQNTPASEWTIYTSANSPLAPSDAISGLFVDNSGVLWVSQEDLYSYNGSTWSDFNQSNTGIFIFGITGGLKINNTNWFSSGVGLIKLQNNNWSLYSDEADPGNVINCPITGAVGITIDPQNNLWIAAYASNAIAKYDGVNNWTIYNDTITSIPGNCITSCIASTSNGTIWVGTSTLSNVPAAIIGCVVKYQNGKWTTYTSSNSNLPAQSIGTIAVDKNNTLWLYSIINSGELLKFDGTNFNIINTSSVFPPGNAISGFAFDSHNNLWIASLDGVFEFNGNTWESFTTQNSALPNNIVNAVFIDNNDTKWFVCDYTTVVKYTGN